MEKRIKNNNKNLLNLFQDEESRYLGLCVSPGWGRNQVSHAEEMIKD